MKPPSFLSLFAALAGALLCAGCGAGDDEPVRVNAIGSAREFAAPLTHIDTRAGQIMLAATARGLVSVDADGTVVPALAQRWIVVDEGKSYIFRLRRARWADGARVDAREVKRLLQARLRAGVRQDPYGPLASVKQIIAMTDDVLELRLTTARPNFLTALAVPEMAIARGTGGTGPYRKRQDEAGGADLWRLLPLDALGHVDEEAEQRAVRLLRAERSARAIVRFREGDADLMLGGTVAELPYVSIAGVRDGFVRFDPVQGLFGLAVARDSVMLKDASVRRAMAMAIDRTALVSKFAVARWKIAEQIVPQQLNLPHLPTPPDWAVLPMERRRVLARDVVSRWRLQHGNAPFVLSISLPKGPGLEILFHALRDQYAQTGVVLIRKEKGADLALIDEVAPYDSVSWYLGRLSCARGVHCDERAEELLRESLKAAGMAERLEMLAQAEPLIVEHVGFIPLAIPVRWSLVRGRLDGFAPSPRAVHPLDRLMK